MEKQVALDRPAASWPVGVVPGRFRGPRHPGDRRRPGRQADVLRGVRGGPRAGGRAGGGYPPGEPVVAARARGSRRGAAAGPRQDALVPRADGRAASRPRLRARSHAGIAPGRGHRRHRGRGRRSPGRPNRSNRPDRPGWPCRAGRVGQGRLRFNGHERDRAGRHPGRGRRGIRRPRRRRRPEHARNRRSCIAVSGSPNGMGPASTPPRRNSAGR